MPEIVLLFIGMFALRITSLIISVRNERRLKAEGAVEYGKGNTILLSAAHFFFYFGSLTEALIRERSIVEYTYLGLGIWILSMVMLVLVIRGLGPLWTVKLIIAPKHKVQTNWLFKNIKHPNYYLNIIPELIGVVFVFQAWWVLCIGFPIYLIPLFRRIMQEEAVMREKLQDYVNLHRKQ